MGAGPSATLMTGRTRAQCPAHVPAQVQLRWAHETQSRLLALGLHEYTLTEYDGLGHSARVDEIGDAAAWLAQRLGADEKEE